MRKVIYALVLVMLGCMTACHSSRQVPLPQAEGEVSATMSLSDRCKALVAGYGDWECVDVPVKVELKSPSRISLSGRAYMRRGKDILISMRFLGMEVATMYITRDSVYATEKLHKYYVAESIADLMAGYDVSVSDMQDALLGRAFVLGSGTLGRGNMKKVKMEVADGMWLIIPEAKRGVEYGFAVSETDGCLLRLSACVSGHQPVSCDYSEWVETSAGIVANRLALAANVRKKNVAANLVWSFGKAEWNNKDALRSWKAPSGYTKLKSTDIIRILSSF